MGVPLFQETSIYTLYTEHIIVTYMHTIGIKKGLEIWMVDLGRSKKTSLKIELLMDPWKSAASPVLPLDISWLNPQQATFKGQMIHILCVEPKEVIWGYCTRQGGSYFIFHSLTLFHEWPGFQTLRWVLAFSACQSYLLRFFMRTHLILQLVWGVESISRRLLLCTKYQ